MLYTLFTFISTYFRTYVLKSEKNKQNNSNNNNNNNKKQPFYHCIRNLVFRIFSQRKKILQSFDYVRLQQNVQRGHFDLEVWYRCIVVFLIGFYHSTIPSLLCQQLSVFFVQCSLLPKVAKRNFLGFQLAPGILRQF